MSRRQIDVQTYPLLHEVCSTVMNDGGGDIEESYRVPGKWESRLAEMELALASLTPEEREMLAAGDQDEMLAIVSRHAELGLVHRFLDEFFEDFAPGWSHD